MYHLTSYWFRLWKNKFKNAIQSELYQMYLAKYARLDNNTIENLGTGRTNNIIQKGIDNWTTLIGEIPMDGLMRVISILLGLFVVSYQIGWIGAIGVISIICASLVVAHYGNKKASLWRRKRRELYTEGDRQIVKYIMSKFEILQKSKVEQELQKIKNIFDNVYTTWIGDCKALIYSFDVQRVVFDIIRLVLAFGIGKGIITGSYTVGDFMLVRGLLNGVSADVRNMNNYMRNYFQQSIFIEKLRDTFDDIPVIEGYKQGKNFIVDSGSISLDNIIYSYGTIDVLKNFSLEIQ